jgi:AcrR family transcriptional regulator
VSGSERPKRLTRTEARQRNRELLLDAAARVIAERGFHGATLDEVADEAGLTKGAVYSQFADKGDLFAAAIERRYRERLNALEGWLAERGETAERTSAAALDFARSVTVGGDWALLFLEAWAQTLRDPEFGRRLRQIDDEIRAALAGLLSREPPIFVPLGDLHAEQVAEMLLAVAHGFGVQHRLDPEHAPDELFAEMMRIFATGLAGRAAS